MVIRTNIRYNLRCFTISRFRLINLRRVIIYRITKICLLTGILLSRLTMESMAQIVEISPGNVIMRFDTANAHKALRSAKGTFLFQATSDQATFRDEKT